MSSGSTNGRSSSAGDDASRAVARSSSVVITSMPSMRLEPPDDVGAGDDDARRQAGEDAVQLVVGEPVVDRRERQAGERRAEQRDRHRLGVEVDQPDVLDARVSATASPTRRAAAAARPPSARRRREPTTTRSPAASATISSSIADVHCVLPAARHQSELGSGLAPLIVQRVGADRERPRASLGAQHLDAGLLVGVALADLRPRVKPDSG